eukprot:GHRR01033806.1.p1 GENE.GHRR01033806.1~~GHRR01033806.1.p1  ORF type:complete len:134 (-),score=30.67 GHRR01033806.1:288-689(-)
MANRRPLSVVLVHQCYSVVNCYPCPSDLQLKGLTILDAQGNIRTLDPITESHLWQAAGISVGRLGIILDLTISIVKNLPVKRDKQDISPNEFVASIGQLQQNYNAAVGAGNALTSLAVWQAVKPWNEVQVCIC